MKFLVLEIAFKLSFRYYENLKITEKIHFEHFYTRKIYF